MDLEQTSAKVSRLRTVPLRDDTVDVIADAIDVVAHLAPFQLPGGRVYQLTVPGGSGRAAALLTLWPSLRRVDATGNGCAVVFTRVESVQLVDGVEVLFRRDTGEFLVVAVGGRIIVRS